MSLNLTGIRFGKLVGITRLKGTGKWLFKCDCGNEKAIIAGHVTQKPKGTISCGCVKESLRKIKGEIEKV